MIQRNMIIHCHFYQPPREDPLSGQVPEEEGAQPFHDWNEKIHATCYLPNAQVGNFKECSFDVGPTLWRWMRAYHEDTCKMIIEQENQQFEKWGIGNGMAHPYHHVILPLANRQEKITQVRWGIENFKTTFKHLPKGIWLPETAVDQETMDVIAEQGMEFIILSPTQAESQVDPHECYKAAGNTKLSLVFYDQGFSTRVSFDPTFTQNADEFSQYVTRQGYSDNLAEPLMTIASDGELYGHHQPFRDLFLHRLLDHSLADNGISMTYPGRWLKTHTPEKETKVINNTSWSCPHGIERWKGACDCTKNGEWKAFLRRALDNLAGVIDEIYFGEVSEIGIDPWELRHQYIKVINNEVNVAELCQQYFGSKLIECNLTRLEFLLAAQYERLRMFTSCAWFFDDFDRIEPKNSVRYAAQAVWLINRACGRDLHKESMAWLSEVKSQRSGLTADVIFSEHLANAKRIASTMKR